MSVPLHRITAKASARTARTENGFWGLDLSAGELASSFSRAADSENLIWHGNAVAARPGYQLLWDYHGEQVNGIWNCGDELIVHAGTNLYRHRGERFQTVDRVGTGLLNAPSQGIVRRQNYTKRTCSGRLLNAWRRTTEERDLLFINDGVRYWFYNGLATVPAADPYWGVDVTAWLEQNLPISFYAAAPFAGVGMNPDNGVGDVDPRGTNRLSQFQTDSFYVDEPTDLFELSCVYGAYQECYPPEIRVRDQSGVWRNLSIAEPFMIGLGGGRSIVSAVSIGAGQAFTVDEENRISALGTGNRHIAADGQDNLRITYPVKKEAPAMINGATVQGLYGPDGTDRVLFLGGSAAAPGADVFSAPDDFLCFYETSIERLGRTDEPITGYCRLSDGRLAVLKNAPDQTAVFFRSYKLVQVGKTLAGAPYEVEAYPSQPGASVQGCVSARTVGVAGNEPCFLGGDGLYTVHSVSNELVNLNQTICRSAAVRPLLERWDKSRALAVNWRDYYLLVCGAEALITDGKQDPGGNLRFLKWRFATAVTALARRDRDLYLGGGNGMLYILNGEAEDDGAGVAAYWETPALEDHGSKLLLRRVFIAVNPDYGAAVRVQIRRDFTAEPERTVPAGRADFIQPDFAAFSFDGTVGVRWLPVAQECGAGKRFSMRFSLPARSALAVWGLRTIYEKGESVK